MKLVRVAIENFRQLGTPSDPFELSFTDGLGRVRELSLLVGPNTSGKTSVLDAIGAALDGPLEMSAVRSGFHRSPQTVVRRGARSARVTCWLQFSPDEISAAREYFELAGHREAVPDATDVKLVWEYPDPRANSDFGFTVCDPPNAWTLLKGRVTAARLLATGQVDWRCFNRVGSAFTFDQERTGSGKTISRRLWNIIHGEDVSDRRQRRTTNPRTILIDLALRALVPSDHKAPGGQREFAMVQDRYARVCAPRRIVGAIEDALGEFDVYFNDGLREYRYDGLSSGERMVLQLLIRFVSEHMHRSIVMVDEVELNQHPIWQRKLLHLLPAMGDDNQIIATTHSPYLRAAVRPDAVVDLGDLDDDATTVSHHVFGGGA